MTASCSTSAGCRQAVSQSRADAHSKAAHGDRPRRPHGRVPPDCALGLPIGDWWTPAVRAMGGMTWVPRTSDNATPRPAYIERARQSGLWPSESGARSSTARNCNRGAVLIYGCSSRDYPEGNVLRGTSSTGGRRAMPCGRPRPPLADIPTWRGIHGVVRGPRVGARPNDAADLCDILGATCARAVIGRQCGRLPVDELVDPRARL